MEVKYSPKISSRVLPHWKSEELITWQDGEAPTRPGASEVSSLGYTRFVVPSLPESGESCHADKSRADLECKYLLF